MPTGAKENQSSVRLDTKCSLTNLKNDNMANYPKHGAELTIEGAIGSNKRAREHLPSDSDAGLKKQKMKAVKKEGKVGEGAGHKNGYRTSCTLDSMSTSDEKKMEQKSKDHGDATTANTEHEAKAEGRTCKCHETEEYCTSIEEKIESLEAEIEELREELEDLKREMDMRFDWLNGAVTALARATGWLMLSEH
ncbi:unnamed protein product [Clonostachys byssicola]|uniref:Uncharacterized protein n=1 Tax=Clonostachys byssicola TaxID=160290 RepID=A0A9N9UG58_9HYPO|nr:unnamed protein product [Clonostachys byssicola]